MSEEHGEEKKNHETGKSRQGRDGLGNGDTEINQNAEPGTRNPEPASGDTAGPKSVAVESPEATPHPFEALLDEYPLREPSEDPVWSVRIVKGWMYFLAFNFAWMFLFFILGIFYE